MCRPHIQWFSTGGSEYITVWPSCHFCLPAGEMENQPSMETIEKSECQLHDWIHKEDKTGNTFRYTAGVGCIHFHVLYLTAAL